MDKFKEFYNEKNGKIILFFGFYLIFFIFLGFYMKGLNNTPPDNTNKDEIKITSYTINNLVNSDYKYDIKILDNDESITFSGTKNNIDYANYENKYFLDIYNINQLLKRSKFIESNDYVLSYELNNKEINDLLLTTKDDGINKIDVIVNKNSAVNKIVMDLSNYMGKNTFQITINYNTGEENENSFS